MVSNSNSKSNSSDIDSKTNTQQIEQVIEFNNLLSEIHKLNQLCNISNILKIVTSINRQLENSKDKASKLLIIINAVGQNGEQ